jgi:hypothetical protein
VVELEADQEHVEDHPHLAERAQDTEARGWEEARGEPRRHETQEGRPQQDAREHLPHDVGLAERTEGEPAETRGEEDDEELKEEEADVGRPGRGSGRGRRGDGRRGRRPARPRVEDREDDQHGEADEQQVAEGHGADRGCHRRLDAGHGLLVWHTKAREECLPWDGIRW